MPKPNKLQWKDYDGLPEDKYVFHINGTHTCLEKSDRADIKDGTIGTSNPPVVKG